MRNLVLPALLAASLCFGATGKKTDAPSVRATCRGSDTCSACSSCKYCKHCAELGGTCGVKKKLESR